MTAGKGVQHCEMFPLLSKEKDNPLELFQIWLNLPKAKKFAMPHFAMLWSDQIPLYKATDKNGNSTEVRVIAGKIDNVSAPAPAPNSWAADRDHEVAVWTIRMDADAEWKLPLASASVNRSLFFYDGGTSQIDDKTFSTHQAVELHADHEVLIKNGNTTSCFLLLQGKPINEPVVQHGPFVMNSEAEIRQAMDEYRKTHFGGWPWPSYEHVHPRERTRFAKYPDGVEETRP
jgi:redox-sensitive bicupin YhaK (pirin superfamily)